MKILIVSDTHRKDDNLERIIEEEAPFDMLIHLGDAEGSEYTLPYLIVYSDPLQEGSPRAEGARAASSGYFRAAFL